MKRFGSEARRLLIERLDRIWYRLCPCRTCWSWSCRARGGR